MKKLIILPNNIGDVIMATPLFEALKRQDPSCELHFLVDSGYEGGVLNNPHIDKIHLIPRTDSAKALRDEESFPVEAFSLGAWIETLNKIGFDQIINLSQHRLYSALVSLIDAKEKLGMVLSGEGIDCINGFWNRYLFAIPYERTCNSLHAIDIYKKVAGVQFDPAAPKMFPTDSELNVAEKFLKDHGWDGSNELIVFQPGAAFNGKMWPVQNWIDLGKMILDSGRTICICGAPAESVLVESIAKELPTAIVAAGKTTFRESAILTKFASVVITGDTALMHATAALGTKVIALFGSTSPVETGPYGEGHLIFVDQACSKQPCFLHSCDQPEFCMNRISPKSVFESINGGVASFVTTIENGTYRLIPQTGNLANYIDLDSATLIQILLTRGVETVVPQSVREELERMEKRLTSAYESLEQFSKGDESAYEQYAGHVTSLQDATGIGAFLAAIVNIGLNSIPLTEIQVGVRAMLELIMGYRDRLREVLHG